MKKKRGEIIRSILLGKRYSQIDNISDQVRYLTMNGIFSVAIIPLVVLGITMINVSMQRTVIDFTIAFLCLLSLILLRTKIPLSLIPVFPVTCYGLYCLYLLYVGDFNLWAAVWIFAFPPIVIFLCRIVVGLIESILVLAGAVLLLFMQISQVSALTENAVSIRIIAAYILIFALTVIYESISMVKDRKEKLLNAQLAHERDIIQTMKDNIHQGVFLMDTELKILSQYSLPLVSILSYYDSDLVGKNFLDIINASFDSRELQALKGYFAMIFGKTKSAKVLELANPISEFEYKANDQLKTLSTRFQLIERENSDPVIIGIIQDITKEKEFEKELQAQKEAQELEMKNLFNVIQIDPLVFQDFIDDSEANFNYINSLMKDRSLSEKQVVTKIFQNIHGIKSNAIILGLETFGEKLHVMEDEIKAVSNKDKISIDDILNLIIKIENLFQEIETYTAITKKINAYKSSNQMDTIFFNSLSRAVEKLSEDARKKVKIKAGQIDITILSSKLRKPVKEILHQCVRNSIYHGIEPEAERVKKGKNPEGLLTFSIKMADHRAEIVYSDDGGGLDWQKIKKKYLELNPKAKVIDKKVLLNSIFKPEFSTADETSTAAGRGVGLSFVADLVKENHGTINVNSSENGLTFKFTFHMPK